MEYVGLTFLCNNGIKIKIFYRIFADYNFDMKKRVVLITLSLVFCFLFSQNISAQCSICTKTAQQLGEQPAKGLNAGIIYLASAPFLIAGYVFYRWKKSAHTD